MSRTIFRNAENDLAVKTEGYIKMRLFEKEQMSSLIALARANNFTTDGTYKKRLHRMNISLYDSRIDIRENFFDEVWAFISSTVNNLLLNYEPVMINFWSKLEDGGALELHQNWSHVDEEKYTSLSLWIPLQPTNRFNGTMEVVPRSHQKIKTARGPGIEHVFANIQEHIIAEYLKPIDLQLGEAVFIDDSILHYTGQNRDTRSRDAIQILLKPAEADALLYVGGNQEKKNTVMCYKVERKFFSHLIPREVSKISKENALLVKTFTAGFSQLTVEKFRELMNR